ncbi:DUF2399 domain-containing protein [Frankia sp. AgB32]|uniref:DUF2399 domain-containing protein n=1 Tax=Frankia sp. AgB32 TaxID=631119 RepID=UPI00200E7175|nr:DUF2399 domain-containing protein [Frankia sp. AgB32]MCK9894186.1 DUF2399 domain-containing protein [Frankia sp. AgB32]
MRGAGEDRRDAVALLENIGRDRAISVVGAPQDDMERYAIGASSLYIELRRPSDVMPYNQAPVVIGSEADAARVQPLADRMTSFQPQPQTRPDTDPAEGRTHDSPRAFVQRVAGDTKARDDVRHLLAVSGPDGVLLVVENRQAAETVCGTRPDLPVVWCHGQPPSAVVSLIVQAARQTAAVVICADADLGGVHITAHITAHIHDSLPPATTVHVIDVGTVPHDEGRRFNTHLPSTFSSSRPPERATSTDQNPEVTHCTFHSLEQI